MIGAWGYKFFETDHDYNIVAHLGADMGLLPHSQPLPQGVGEYSSLWKPVSIQTSLHPVTKQNSCRLVVISSSQTDRVSRPQASGLAT